MTQAMNIHEAAKVFMTAGIDGENSVNPVLLMEECVRNGADINAEDARGQTPLHIAAQANNTEVINYLLGSKDIKLDAVDNICRTPLMLAARSTQVAAVDKLLVKGASVQATDKDGDTALHLAVSKQYDPNKSLRVVRLLLEYGADPYLLNNENETPFSIAEEVEDEQMLTDESPVPLELLSYHFPKRIIICCDGTWNDRETEQPFTNVTKILSCIRSAGYMYYYRETKSTVHMRYQQSVHYIDGIGTGTTWFGQRMDGAKGTSINRKICEAYRIICEQYSRPTDQIILIGFSRGAFTIQCLANLINDTGLIRPSWTNEEFPSLFRLWATGNHTKKHPAGHPEPDCTDTNCLEKRSRMLKEKGRLRRKISIDAYAAWDTVAAIRDSIISNPLYPADNPFAFVGTQIPSCVRKAYHALALEEKRWSFTPVILTSNSNRDANGGIKKDADVLEQCWFLGSHGDVGGGNENSGLANISLVWMIGRLKSHVDFDDQVILNTLRNVSARSTVEAGMGLQNAQPDAPAGRSHINRTGMGPESVVSAYNSLRGWWMVAQLPVLWAPVRHLGVEANSNQEIHFTVQGILKEQRERQKLCVPGFEFKNEGYDTRVWKKDDKSIKEQKISEAEKYILNLWLSRPSGTANQKLPGWAEREKKQLADWLVLPVLTPQEEYLQSIIMNHAALNEEVNSSPVLIDLMDEEQKERSVKENAIVRYYEDKRSRETGKE
ncbi:uncharacterized protein PG998_010182 [Apiospora kogelbergensis]|uniref:uncharacterized protein n=1 Tax=Apiospora kogelbergensis TaxID=1337665 RepID=UPI003132920D